MKIQIRSAIFVLGILFVSFLLPYSAFAEQVDSLLPERSEQEIVDKWNKWMDDEGGEVPIYSETPNSQSPYSPGKLNDTYLQRGLDAANFYRFLSGLQGDLILDPALNQQAQYGAVLVSTKDRLSHHPAQPTDMPKGFYDIGYKSTSSSNLFLTYGKDKNILVKSVQAYMDDSDVTNLDRVGHRRWILSPELQKIGFGIAEKADSDEHAEIFSAMQVLDTSRSGLNEYNYSSYPNKGSFPIEAFNSLQAWSVQLNPDKFQTPLLSDVRVELIRVSDQKTWTFDSKTQSKGFPQAYYNVDASDIEWYQQSYFNVETTSYGYGYAVIFRPDDVQLLKDGDQFKVTITGLKKTDGSPAEISYQTNFFKINSEEQEKLLEITTPQKELSVKIGEEVDVPAIIALYNNGAGYHVKSNLNFSTNSNGIEIKNGKVKGIKAGKHELNIEYSGKSIKLIVSVYELSSFSDIKSHWAYDDIQWAINKRIVSGEKEGSFRPNDLITEAEFFAMLFSLYSDDSLIKDIDSSELSKYYDIGVWSDRYYRYAGTLNLNVDLGVNSAKLRNKVISRAGVAQIVAGLAGRNYANDDDAILYLLNMEYSAGKTAATIQGYAGKENLTRADAIVFLKNLKEQGFQISARPGTLTQTTENEKNGGFPDRTVKAEYKDGKLTLKAAFSEAANKTISVAVHGPAPLVDHITTQSVAVDSNGNLNLEIADLDAESLNIYIYTSENYSYAISVELNSAMVNYY